MTAGALKVFFTTCSTIGMNELMVIGFFGREINSNDEIGSIIHRRLNIIRSKTGLIAYHKVGLASSSVRLMRLSPDSTRRLVTGQDTLHHTLLLPIISQSLFSENTPIQPLDLYIMRDK